jgi:uncharacterized RDD family membrane protein YckC
MSEVGWYYDGAGQQVGPLGQAALVELIRAGRIAPGTRVWRPGLAAWTPWEAVADLGPQVTPPLPPPPPPFASGSYAADVLAGAGAGALYPKAPLGGRFLAALVDGLATVPAGLLWVFTVVAFTADATALGVVVALAAVAATLWALVYSFTKDGRPGGQSIGKKMMGLMVVHLPSNQPCTPGQSALRYLVMFLLNLVPYVGWLIEPIVLLTAAGGRRLGDSAAGTQVIRATDLRPRG